MPSNLKISFSLELSPPEGSHVLGGNTVGEIPHDMDWVRARHACSYRTVFEELRVGVERDIATANEVRGLGPDTEFRITSGDTKVFVVFQNSSPRVKFTVGQDRIEIDDEVTGQKIVALLTVNDEGRCKLKVEREELEQWQVRRRALEGLLFRPVATR